MKAELPFYFKSAVSVIDQVLLSGLNLLIGVALIRYASKETYGFYSQLLAAGVLTSSILGALVGSALTTLAVRLQPLERQHMVARVARLQWLASGVLALLAGLAVGVLVITLQLSERPLQLAIAFALFVLTLSSREYCRTAYFIEGQPEKVAQLDLAFVVLTMLCAAGLFWFDDISVDHIFFALALSNGLAAGFLSLNLTRQTGTDAARGAYVADARALWVLSRWAVVGSVLAWLGNNSYLYLAGGLVGVAALADLNAARLILIPIVVIGMAWSKIAQPTMGRMIAQSDWLGLKGLLRNSLIAIEGFTAIYAAFLLLGFPWLSKHVLGEKYQGIALLVALWGAYFAINAARTMGTVLLSSFGAFQALFWQGALSLLVLLTLSVLLIPLYGVIGALAAMIVVEAWELLVNHTYLLPRVRRQHGTPD